MSKLPLLKPQQLARILVKLGFKPVRQEGSHMFFEHPDGRTTVIPCHAGEEIRRGLLNKIVKKDLEMDRKEFLKLL
jgi:predicted RNA binding protein YcfA (HicA-like mRNA interferase family)